LKTIEDKRINVVYEMIDGCNYKIKECIFKNEEIVDATPKELIKIKQIKIALTDEKSKEVKDFSSYYCGVPGMPGCKFLESGLYDYDIQLILEPTFLMKIAYI
ncbi:hypothetical protein MXB_3587, partial [Myxobolus squamalis]